jgi:hypothetical protein
LITKRQVLGQLVLCKGCCCGRTDRGLPEVPVERIKEIWQREKLNRSIQLTISGCLGPCDVPILWHPGKHRRPLAQVQTASGITQIAWSPDDQRLGVGTESGAVLVYFLT